MSLTEDILAYVRENASEDAPLSSNALVAQIGSDQAKTTGSLSQLMKRNKNFHRRKIKEFSDLAGKEIEMYAYWFDATKVSDYHRAMVKGEIPVRGKRGAAGREVANTRAPASSAPAAPIFAQKVVQGRQIGNILFIEQDGKTLFCSMDNFKAA